MSAKIFVQKLTTLDGFQRISGETIIESVSVLEDFVADSGFVIEKCIFKDNVLFTIVR